MRITGIDYSYSCPAIAYMDYSSIFDLKNISIATMYRNAEKMKFTQNVTVEGFSGFKFNSDIEKFSCLAAYTVNSICQDYQKVYVALEDYSFGSHSGRNFTIGENAGILKNKLFEKSCGLRLFSPTFVKRFVKEQNEDLAVKFSEGTLKKDGSAKIGALKKNAMHEIFCWKFDIDLEKHFGFAFKKYVSPLSDIVDALWILYIFWCEWKIRNNDIEGLSEQEITFIKTGVNGEGLHIKPYVF